MKEINWKELNKGLLLIVFYLLVLPTTISGICQIASISLQNKTNYILVNGSIYFIMILLFLWIYKNTIFEELKNYFKNWKHCIKIALLNWLKALLFMMISNSIILSILGNIAKNEAANRVIIGNNPIFSIITMVIIGPFIEEMLFRKGLKNGFKKKQQFLIISSLLFGLGHVLISLDLSSIDAFIACLPTLLYIIPYSGMGYFLAKSYYETDNIFTSTTAHTLHNAFVVTLVLTSQIIGG